MDLQATSRELRIAASGAAAALTMGLLLGGFMQPNLAGDDRPAGPQIILGKAAERSTGPFDPGPETANYSGRVPDYVMGADWTRPQAARPATATEPTVQIVSSADEPAPVALTRATYQDPPRRHGHYPSMGEDLPSRAPVGQAVDDAYEGDDAPDEG